MNEALDKLLEALEPVAERLGEGAAYVYRLAVRDAVISGVTKTLVAVGLVAVAIVAARAAGRMKAQAEKIDKKHDEKMAILKEKANQNQYISAFDFTKRADTDWEDGWRIGFWAIAIAFLLAAFLFAVDATHHLLNPELKAIEGLLRTVKG